MSRAGKSALAFTLAVLASGVSMPVLAACVAGANGQMSCSGALAGGIAQTNGPVLVLDVSALTQDISVNGKVGVSFVSPPRNGAIPTKAGQTGGYAQPSGNVVLNFSGGAYSVLTTGSKAIGIYGSSLGGFGADGYDAQFLITSAGHGGGAAAGGDVAIVAAGTISTRGDEAHGIVGESIGGSGGKGGSARGFLWGKAGGGGPAGKGGMVTVTSSATITTLGEDAVGIIAQSVGGNGGRGGDASGWFVSSGGGNPAADGNLVKVNHAGRILTKGEGADGILAQSIGGFGGRGGGASGLVAFGSSGASAGHGGAVDIVNSGSIETEHDMARAILAQSIGGGGGHAGKASRLVAHGASGVHGGNGGAVSIANTGTGSIVTHGEDSDGIYAQSIGGGGGDGSRASGLVGIGGKAGAGGHGGSVTIQNAQSIATHDAESSAIYAQSIGGGGGDGGNAGGLVALGGSGGAGGNGGAVSIASSGALNGQGEQSYGIFAQSIGGGGGDGGRTISGALVVPVNVAVGGSGGDGGDGGVVKVTTTGARTAISTDGDGANAIFAQSIGGGGGNGSMTAAIGVVSPVSIAVSVGGSGGYGGNADTVTVSNGNALTTRGANAAAVLAQSVGGGGGTGGFSFAGTLGALSISTAVGGTGGSGGSAEDVVVDNKGTIRTYGDLSHGLQAQSIGGGGGSGGGAVASSTSVAVSNLSGAIAVAVGGKGGDGNQGAAVEITNTGAIRTGQAATGTRPATGAGAHAILAQSIGGGGGAGGFAGSGALSVGSKGFNFALALGGEGGGGNKSNSVEVDNDGDLVTRGKGAHGIFAQSIGGGGGDGGLGLTATLSVATDIPTARVGIALGGSGGSGGVGDQVWVDNSGSIRTSGDEAYGIKAQSIGGGGGAGGLAVSGMLTASGSGAQIGVAVGGNGGKGDSAGLVNVKNDAAITTQGKDAVALLAQSVGGGGGNGGVSVVGSIMNTSTSSAQIGVSVGGKGGTGGAAGTVEVANLEDGELITAGYGAHAIQAQSVGGGGGKGGLAVTAMLGLSGQSTSVNVGVSVGGKGGAGGIGNSVTVANAADILVKGGGASGIFAQSIGGGGGDGGGAFTGLATLANAEEAKAKSVNIQVSVGGEGGSGNVSGAVSVKNTGDITTGFVSKGVVSGSGSHAIFAQSIGGGGGIGGRANAFNLIFGKNCESPGACKGVDNDKNNLALAASVGGNGGEAGHGAAVSVKNEGDLTTYGGVAHGIYAQSIGGGGGDGGNGTLGLDEMVPDYAEEIISKSFERFDKLPNSRRFDIVVGGRGGASGDGAVVEVLNAGEITTHGLSANAILAQSIGGGGGSGGRAVQGETGKIGVGGAGSGGGDGAEVRISITDDATLTTHGNYADAILAQSIGGGGGIAGSITTAENAADVRGVSLVLRGGDGGDGGEVIIDVDGHIVTTGRRSNGIFAQSIGGGGGLAGDVGSFYSGSAGDEGEGSAVTIILDGTISTSGDYSTGIFAQSDSGSGSGGEIDIEVAGVIDTAVTGQGGQTPVGSIGILAQSTGPKGGDNIAVHIAEDSTLLAGRTLADARLDQTAIALMLVGGATNTIDNLGRIATADGVNGGYAIHAAADPRNTPATKPTLTLTNAGTITGNIALGDSLGRLVNDTHGLLETGRILAMAKGQIVNAGTIAPGGAGVVMTTAVAGDFEQTASGRYALDIDLASQGNTKLSDRLDFAGNARLAGVVEVQFLNTPVTLSGSFSSIIATATGTLDASALSVLDRPAVDFVLDTEGSQLRLGYQVDFRGQALLTSADTLGDYLNGLALAGLPPEIETFLHGLVAIGDHAEYEAALARLEPSDFTATTHSTMAAGQNFANAMMSCKLAEAPARFDAEGQCAWTSLDVTRVKQAAYADTEGFSQTSLGLMGGMQAELRPGMQAGLGLGVEQYSTRIGTGGQMDGIRVQAGAVLKTQIDNTSFSAALNAGLAHGAASRFLALPGVGYELTSDQLVSFVSASGRVAHTFEFDDVYMRPGLDIGLGHITRHAYTENGGPLALDVSSASTTYLTLTPSIEVGGEFALGDALLRPFARLGVVETLELAGADASARFIGANADGDSFTTPDQVAGTRLDLTAGASLIFDNGAVLRFTGDLKLAPHLESYGLNAKLSVPF
ncbi:MAG: autotransporter outer membrane beta-barrel domain-containing protein [Devosia sp.]|nr:autotransporter outer membrane beta-barrel domain-containing protein [Devosia sp.]